MNIVGFFKKHIILANLLLALAIIIVIISGVLLWLDSYTNHGEAVEVPDVKGLSIENATSLFQINNLNCLVIDSLFVKNAVAGTIIETIPPIGTLVKKGRTIYLTINFFSAQLLTIPDVVDMSQRQALSMLKFLGFELVEEKIVPGAFRDLVVGLEAQGKTLTAGDKLPANCRLILLVSSGTGEINFDSDYEDIDDLEIISEESWD
jgi:beta-lactam-binding protein with PASTA domain